MRTPMNIDINRMKAVIKEVASRTTNKANHFTHFCELVGAEMGISGSTVKKRIVDNDLSVPGYRQGRESLPSAQEEEYPEVATISHLDLEEFVKRGIQVKQITDIMTCDNNSPHENENILSAWRAIRRKYNWPVTERR